MQILTGHHFYGQQIGILVFSTVTPRIPGDAGHAASFNYPVRYEVVQGGYSELIEGSETIKTNIRNACLKLKEQGIRGILGDCGMMSIYQDCMGSEVELPFVGSSLCQIPMVWQMIGQKGTIGILTGHDGLLGRVHLLSSGWREDIKISVQGLQNEPHFAEIVIDGGLNLDIGRMREDVISAMSKLVKKTNDLRAVIIECSNLATYSKELNERFDLPVFDTISAANLLQYSVNPPTYI